MSASFARSRADGTGFAEPDDAGLAASLRCAGDSTSRRSRRGHVVRNVIRMSSVFAIPVVTMSSRRRPHVVKPRPGKSL